MRRFALAALALASLAAVPAPARAATDPTAPDWPCIQRKVPHLAAAQMWDGPPLDGLAGRPVDAELERVIAFAAARRTSIEEAASAVRAYAETLDPAVRDERLTRAFAGVLDEIDRQRATLIDGIERYFRRQRELADRVRRVAGELSELRKKAAADEAARPPLAELQERYDWDTRVFGERQESLNYICETPVMLEQRAFDLAREIRALMRE